MFGLKDSGVGWVYDARNQALIPAPVKARVDWLEDVMVAARSSVPDH